MNDEQTIQTGAKLFDKTLEALEELINALLSLPANNREQFHILQKFAEYAREGGDLRAIQFDSVGLEDFHKAAKEHNLTYYAVVNENVSDNVFNNLTDLFLKKHISETDSLLLKYSFSVKPTQEEFEDLLQRINNEPQRERKLLMVSYLQKLNSELDYKNFETAEEGLVDYYAYQIKASKSKVDFLLNKARDKGLSLNMIEEIYFKRNQAG